MPSLEKTQVSSPITLDVGGIQFKTSKETLLNAKGSYFEILVQNMMNRLSETVGDDENEQQTDSALYQFIDRDGTHFRYILNFMRGIPVVIPTNIKPILKEEISFYGIQGMDALVN
ncbi:hypothetical protein SAMD00019534_005260 [Acytostelium subglobosum LB1]|uniref:hypothetical protein n=1 Tax=Acytostelium subglobosum LB1 TaxID=1410327 RepID=UPI000644FA7D|nr:hypothetical protein SAMD00019534_005260 [Acytostelium subglobosum LB1]GAM17351.1 hypothetical protein SAMD00019534_005260 [Acytostelium subglobosum LB1]|eukprot:XP_012759413.1 hypothetical protein SAMD00019534_005260 [Acytostelium subglobosum LB1]